MKHPDTKFGLAGPLQGLNTGVVLFRLDRMRSNAKFTSQVDPWRPGFLRFVQVTFREMKKLSDFFQMTFYTGDQVKRGLGDQFHG